MIELTFRIDPLNPGHYYACCGLLELASFYDPNTESIFNLNPQSVRRGSFTLRCFNKADLCVWLSDLRDASVELEPEGDDGTRAVTLKLAAGEMALDWWLDNFHEKAQSLKCWAGQVTTAKLMDELPRMLPVDADPDDLFYERRMMKTKFGIDPRAAWNALDMGYSPNEHNQDAATFPAVELLGAIGLQGFRPSSTARSNIRFHMWQVWLGRVPARRAAREPWRGLTVETRQFSIARRGSFKYFTFAAPEER